VAIAGRRVDSALDRHAKISPVSLHGSSRRAIAAPRNVQTHLQPDHASSGKHTRDWEYQRRDEDSSAQPIEGLRGRGQSQEPHDRRNELRVSQSAVSRQIAVLEEYGVQLFTRERIGVN
jgi:hypothetical protein